jgi:hypothetical protein
MGNNQSLLDGLTPEELQQAGAFVQNLIETRAQRSTPGVSTNPPDIYMAS